MTSDIAVRDEGIIEAEIVDAEIVDAEIVEEQPIYQGCIIIEWPASPQGKYHKPIPGWGCTLINAETGRQFNTCRKIDVHADAENIITADLTMFADEDGSPVFELEPGDAKGSLKIPALEGGKPREGVFQFIVAGMRIREERSATQETPPQAS